MIQKVVTVGNICIANDLPLVLLAGPCVIEGEGFTLKVAAEIAAIANRVGIPLVFKSSFDKANRTSRNGFRGPGMDDGLRILQRVKDELGLPVVTDIHESHQVAAVAEVGRYFTDTGFFVPSNRFY